MKKKRHATEYAEVEALLESCRTQERAYIESIQEQDLPIVRRLLTEYLENQPEPARRTIAPRTALSGLLAGGLALGLLGYVAVRLDLVGSQSRPPVAQGTPGQRATSSTGASDAPPRITDVRAMNSPGRHDPGAATSAASPSAKGIKAIPMPPAASPGEDRPAGKTWTIVSDLPVGQVKITLSEPALHGVLTADVSAGTPAGVGCDWTASAAGKPLANQAKSPATISFPITRESEAIVVGVKRNNPSGTCKATALHIVPAPPSDSGERRASPTATPTPDPVESPGPADDGGTAPEKQHATTDSPVSPAPGSSPITE